MLEAIEAALVAAGKTAVPEFKTAEGYAGQLDINEDDKGALAKLLARFPALFVLLESGTYRREDNALVAGELRFSTIVCCRSLRDRDEVRHQAQEIVERLLVALANSNLGLDAIAPLTPESIDLIFSGAGMVVYGLRWRTAYDAVSHPAV